jgi:P-type E1-E2 ATPase
MKTKPSCATPLSCDHHSLQVRPAIEDCHAAGIRVLVITGDNKLTAEAICRSIGVFEEGQELEGSSLTGLAFAAMSDAGASKHSL